MKIDETEVECRFEQFKEAARSAGIKLTHQRLEIFRAVASSVEHPSAEDIYQAVRESIPTISLDTVYRTLWLFIDLGLLKTFGHREERARFDANLEHHHHYRCVKCGMIRDFESAELNDLPIPASVNRFGDIVSAQVEVQGICADCAQKSNDVQMTSDSHTEERDKID